jgi:hypothetical protein
MPKSLSGTRQKARSISFATMEDPDALKENLVMEFSHRPHIILSPQICTARQSVRSHQIELLPWRRPQLWILPLTRPRPRCP